MLILNKLNSVTKINEILIKFKIYDGQIKFDFVIKLISKIIQKQNTSLVKYKYKGQIKLTHRGITSRANKIKTHNAASDNIDENLYGIYKYKVPQRCSLCYKTDITDVGCFNDVIFSTMFCDCRKCIDTGALKYVNVVYMSLYLWNKHQFNFVACSQSPYVLLRCRRFITCHFISVTNK